MDTYPVGPVTHEDVHAYVEQLLRTNSTAEIDTRAPLDEVVDALERIAKSLTGR